MMCTQQKEAVNPPTNPDGTPVLDLRSTIGKVCLALLLVVASGVCGAPRHRGQMAV